VDTLCIKKRNGHCVYHKAQWTLCVSQSAVDTVYHKAQWTLRAVIPLYCNNRFVFIMEMEFVYCAV